MNYHPWCNSRTGKGERTTADKPHRPLPSDEKGVGGGVSLKRYSGRRRATGEKERKKKKGSLSPFFQPGETSRSQGAGTVVPPGKKEKKKKKSQKGDTGPTRHRTIPTNLV